MNHCAKELIAWYDNHRRPLPWRETINIYHTWVCEVMSQQTTLAVVVPKFSEFLKQLPTVDDLAACDEDKLRQLWSGLGYYARARNLKKGAQFISQLDGRFPQSYREWLEIPGCGPYTAAVIASICYSEKVACVDGNVVRVVSRLLALSKDVWSASGQSAIRAYVTRMLPDNRPGDFNQAMMELGATVCRKTQPRCHMCPLQQQCLAFARNCIDICPPSKPRRNPMDVDLLVLLWRRDDTFAMVERTKGFLLNTVGFPLISEVAALETKRTLKSLPELQVFELSGRFSHAITHHRITGKVLVAAEVAKSISADKLWQSLGLPRPLWVERSAIAAHLSTALDSKVFKLFQDDQEASQSLSKTNSNK